MALLGEPTVTKGVFVTTSLAGANEALRSLLRISASTRDYPLTGHCQAEMRFRSYCASATHKEKRQRESQDTETKPNVCATRRTRLGLCPQICLKENPIL